MAWTNSITFLFIISLVFSANAQESLWKTVNGNSQQTVPSYSGGLSPFPQKQKKVEEISFEPVVEDVSDVIEQAEKSNTLSESERRKVITTAILKDLKDFLDEKEVYVPTLAGVVIDAVIKSGGKYKVFIEGVWLGVGDTLSVPVKEATEALDLLDRLEDISPELALTVEEAVLTRTDDKTEDEVAITEIKDDIVIFKDSLGNVHEINFVKSPY